MRPETAFTLGELAQRFELELRGTADTCIEGVGTLSGAGANQLGFLANTAYRRELRDTHAGAVVLRAEHAADAPCPVLVARDPYTAFAEIAALFEAPSKSIAGAHSSAVIDAQAEVDPTACIGPHCSVGARARIGAGAVLGPGCVIGDDCSIGAGCVLVARVTLVTRVRLGRRVRIHPGAVLGADGFGLAMKAGHWIKVPQLGGVEIGDDCEIGANTTIDRGALDDTVLEEDVRLDNQIQIAHNVHIGACTAIAGCVGIAGSTRIGARCMIGGQAGLIGHLSICDDVVISAGTLVSKSITQPGVYTGSVPLQRHADWVRNFSHLRRLDALAERVRTLEHGHDGRNDRKPD